MLCCVLLTRWLGWFDLMYFGYILVCCSCLFGGCCILVGLGGLVVLLFAIAGLVIGWFALIVSLLGMC